ncbi:Peptidase S1C [Parasponia andersonii]|uniref:Peptidase S1C n=1 Tax=Parasponia andersonii TaxID=3476 RepID=A0A2P5ASI5_PARAD|nr:Peptidase S1C [Parasponia andersonii]
MDGLNWVLLSFHQQYLYRVLEASPSIHGTPPLLFLDFTRKLLAMNRNSIVRIVTIAAAGSGLSYFYADNNGDSKSTIEVSIPAPFRESVSLPWKIVERVLRCPSFFLSDNSQFGMLPLFSVTAASISSAEPAGLPEGIPRHSGGCLGRDTFANAAARVNPAVVNISLHQGMYGIFGGKSIGSGTIIDKDGTILTCAHAVVDFHGRNISTKGKVDVTLQDGRTFEGTVVNADIHSDIAIVKINSKTPLPTAKLGSSRKLQPGDWVLALGCPLSLQNTVTAGIVSCVDRKSSDLGLGGMRRDYLQTDCAINPGNSGGPLINVDGEVVGMNIMKVLAADGLSFAVPIDSVTKIIEHFKTSGRVVRPWLGVKMLDLNEMIIAQLKERDANFPDVKKGILVVMVTPGSPADRAGFHPGDVVIEFDGKSVGSIEELIEQMGDRLGEPLKLVVKRAKDKVVTLTVIPVESNPDI